MRIIAFILAFLFIASPALAQTTIFTFPDPAITNFRLTNATINYSGGTQPWIRIAATLHSGSVVHITGQAQLEGGYLRLIGCGATGIELSGSDPFEDSITCTSDASYVLIIGQSNYTIGAITALTVTVT